MATVTVTLPEPLMDWIESQASAKGYAGAGDYVRALVTRDRERGERPLSIEELDALIQDARSSGDSDRTIDEIFRDAETEARARFGG